MSVYAGSIVSPDLPQQLRNERPERLRPIRPLPTDRISPQNQLRILKAWAKQSLGGRRAATVNEVASDVEMRASTVAMTNPFFSSIGLLQRLAVGTYAPSECVIDFANTNDDNAPRKLSPAFRRAWFGELLVRRLADGAMREEDVLAVLEQDSCAGSEARKPLGFVLEFLLMSGVLERNDEWISVAGSASISSSEPSVLIEINADNQVRISINIDYHGLAQCTPEQIAAFLRGLSQFASTGTK